jgi:DNA-directed RNA polymerase specialized sigma24 family protein
VSPWLHFGVPAPEVARRADATNQRITDAVSTPEAAWLRLARAGDAGIDDLRTWLTTVTGRICLDLLRSRQTRGDRIEAFWSPLLSR